MVASVVNSSLHLFDLRKPSLILKDVPIAMEQNADEINDVDIIEASDSLRVATCDDSGLTLITEIAADLSISQRRLENKHTNSCYRCKFVGRDQLYTTGFDYKLCLWNLKDAKKS
jgi:hypothetical protein